MGTVAGSLEKLSHRIDVSAEVGGALRLQIAGPSEDREPRNTEDNPYRRNVQEDPIGRPAVEDVQHAGGPRRGVAIQDEQSARTAFQEHHGLAGLAGWSYFVDQLAGQLAMLVVHQRQIQQKRAVGHHDQAALVEPLGAHQHVAFRLQQHLDVA